MLEDVGWELFDALAANADNLGNLDDHEAWRTAYDDAIQEEAARFATRYVEAHERDLLDDAATCHEALGELRSAIEQQDFDAYDADEIAGIQSDLRTIGSNIRQFGIHCVIMAGEQDNDALLEAGRVLRDEAGCLKRAAPSVESDAANSVETVVQTLQAMRRDDIPFLLSMLERARRQLQATDSPSQ